VTTVTTVTSLRQATPRRGAPTPPSAVTPRRAARDITRDDLTIALLSLVSSGALVWIVYDRLTPASGAVGFLICWYVAFLGTVWLATREHEGRLVANDRVALYSIASVAILVVVVLGFVLGAVVTKGIPHLRAGFFTHTMHGVGPLAKSTDGGGLHSIVGTFEQVGLAALISIPVGILTAVFLREVRGPLARPTRTLVDAMSGVPSIVAGLFIYTVIVLRSGFSGFAAALGLSILMLPTVTRASEEVLRLVPDGVREASLAVGVSEWRTTWSVVLPTARSGLVTAALLGVARAIGDTAVLLATAGGFDSFNGNVFHGQQDSLPLFVFKQIRTGLISAQTQRAWTGAFVLLLLVLIMFAAARVVARTGGTR
jgi:phosphate transport system permease protein